MILKYKAKGELKDKDSSGKKEKATGQSEAGEERKNSE
jgi:hypothetical protein